MIRLAVLITCHNRRTTTLRCLAALAEQIRVTPRNIKTFLVDDGSTDGTGSAVGANFPEVVVLRGNGDLYWGGGMHLAWAVAMKEDFDHYLWLNDDTTLVPDAVETLLAAFSDLQRTEPSCGIVVGSACDPVTGELTYGGYRDLHGSSLVHPSSGPQPCVTMNGNIVLVNRAVTSAIGNLSPEFRHGSGDNDYGLRARARGFTLWVAPGFQGYCSRNSGTPSWCDPRASVLSRWQALHSPKGQPPGEMLLFARRHLPCWPLVLAKLYLKALFPRPYQRIREQFGKGEAREESRCAW